MTTTISGLRTGGTAATTAATLVPSGAVRENEAMKATLKGLKEAAQNGGASSTMFLPAAGTRYDAFAFSYHTGLAKEMNLKGLKDGQTVKGHIAINISGHATGGRADQIAALAMQKLAEQGIDLEKATAKNDKLFAGLYKAAQSAGWSGDATLRAEGLPEVKITADELSKFAASDDGKWAGNDALRRHFAMTNTYNVRVTLPDGQKLELRNVARNKPDQAEYATSIPIEFPAMKGNTVVEAWPTGSAEVAGYVEARRYHVHIGDEHFYSEKKGIEAAEKYMDAHPEIRWAARAARPNSNAAYEAEEADLAKHHVSPPPFPYADVA
jgi:hypothetical protein